MTFLLALALAAPQSIDTSLPREGLAPLPVRISFDDATAAPHPVIVWSHGLFGSREGYDPLVEAWTAAGYAVVRPTHDDTLEGRSAIDKAKHLRQPDLSTWSQRPRDVQLVIDALPTMTGLPALDLDHVGMGGHSFGAHTAMLLSGVRTMGHADLWDPRPLAFLWISPQGLGPTIQAESFVPVTRPVMMITGSEDAQPFSDKGADWRMTAWTSIDAPARLFFVDGAHHNFGGISGRVLPKTGSADPALVGWIADATTQFWDQQLRGAAPGTWSDPQGAAKASNGRVKVEHKAPADPLAGVDWVRQGPVADAPLTAVEVWATWCGPCLVTLPELAALQAKHSDLRVVALTDEPMDVVTRFAKDLAPGYAIAVDPDGQRVRGLMFGGYGGRGIPSAYLMRGAEVLWGGTPAELPAAIETHR